MLVDAEGKIVDLSPAAEALFGWTAHELAGQFINVLVPERIRQAHTGSVSGYLDAPKHRPMGKIIPVAQHRDGRELQIEIELRPLVIGDEKYVAALVTDAGADRNARLLSEANARAAVGQAIKSPLGEFLEVNPAFCQLVGYDEEELLQMSIQDILNPDDREIRAAAIQRLLAGEDESAVIEVRVIRRSGAEIWLRKYMTIIHGTSFGSDAILSQSVDVSLQKQFEFSLERSNRELEEFAYVASHDLQAPVRNITALIDLIEEDLDPGVLSDEQREYFQMLRDVAAQARLQIQGLLKMSRLQRATPEYVAVNLADIAELAMGQLAIDIHDAGATVEIQPDFPPVRGDTQQLAALFQNLLSNAIKYRRDGVAPEVRVVTDEGESPGFCHFVVADNGIGIRAQDQDRIFQIFKRLHAESDTRYAGTGIGLALAEKIVELHHGKIWVESDGENCGSAFHVLLPLADLSTPATGLSTLS